MGFPRISVSGSGLAAALVLALGLGSAPVEARRDQAATSVAPERELCRQATRSAEASFRLPPQLLAALALAESGRWDRVRRESYPWPWTVNAAGAGRYFDSKAAAVTAVHTLLRQGVDSIDVGCMQVNLRHHGEAFASVEDALDPDANVRYAARFLKSLYSETRSWNRSVTYYHSRTKTHYKDYLAGVYELWRDERRRVAKARRAETVARATQLKVRRVVKLSADAAD